MIIPLAFTPEMQYQDFKITKKKDGRQFCRIAYTLRHTFASKLYKKTNGDSKLVSEQLRHSSVGFTVKIYIHLEQKYKTNTMESFEI